MHAKGDPKIIVFDRLLFKIRGSEKKHVIVVSKTDLKTKIFLKGEYKLLLKRSKIFVRQEYYVVAFAVVTDK